MRTGRFGTLLVITAVVAAICLAALASSLGPPGPAPVRLLLVGDSVTQGSSGDWTWRYRLWEHLTTSGVDVDLVGPRDDLLDLTAASFGSQEYVDPEFDRDHAARWGMGLADMDPDIGELVRTHRPDVVVELLGVNDLVWRGAAPTEVLDELTGFIGRARRADPDVDIVLGTIPQLWAPGVPELNARLPDLAQAVGTQSSQVLVASPADGLVEGVDTYDASHLSATGEVKVAAGVSDALAHLGIGSPYPRPLPAVPTGPREPAALTAQPGDTAAHLAWMPPPGATAAFIWVRDRTTGESWRRLPFPVTGTTRTVGALVNDHVYEVRLQSAKGVAVAEDVFSNVVSVRPGPRVVPPFPVLMPSPATPAP